MIIRATWAEWKRREFQMTWEEKTRLFLETSTRSTTGTKSKTTKLLILYVWKLQYVLMKEQKTAVIQILASIDVNVGKGITCSVYVFVVFSWESWRSVWKTPRGWLLYLSNRFKLLFCLLLGLKWWRILLTAYVSTGFGNIAGAEAAHVHRVLPEQAQIRAHCVRVYWHLFWSKMAE